MNVLLELLRSLLLGALGGLLGVIVTRLMQGRK